MRVTAFFLKRRLKSNNYKHLLMSPKELKGSSIPQRTPKFLTWGQGLAGLTYPQEMAVGPGEQRDLLVWEGVGEDSEERRAPWPCVHAAQQRPHACVHLPAVVRGARLPIRLSICVQITGADDYSS